MRSIISVVIFGKKIDEQSVKNIQSEKVYDKQERGFDFAIYEDTNDLYYKLNEHRGFDVIVTIGDLNDFPELLETGFEIKKRWIHFEDFDNFLKSAKNSLFNVFVNNINRKNEEPLFSIFSCAYKTPKAFAKRLYDSLLKQTYKNWNWWILDDSPEGTTSYFEKIKDCRVTIIKNHSSHGNIGFNKHMIAMCCDGDYLVEIDHDDEITPDCLELLKKSFDTFKDCVFSYSYCLEIVDDKPVWYDKGFALGLGTYISASYNGIYYTNIPSTPDVNVLSMRHIVSLPNHVRCWKKTFYHSIGGHNPELSIMDDADILIRTILNGKCCKIPKILYIQHEGTSNEDSRSTTTQSIRHKEILRMNVALKQKYDEEIHNFAIKQGIEDPYWDENLNESNIFLGPLPGLINLNYILNV